MCYGIAIAHFMINVSLSFHLRFDIQKCDFVIETVLFIIKRHFQTLSHPSSAINLGNYYIKTLFCQIQIFKVFICKNSSKTFNVKEVLNSFVWFFGKIKYAESIEYKWFSCRETPLSMSKNIICMLIPIYMKIGLNVCIRNILKVLTYF